MLSLLTYSEGNEAKCALNFICKLKFPKINFKNYLLSYLLGLISGMLSVRVALVMLLLRWTFFFFFREVSECVISSLWASPVCNDGEGKYREDEKEAINVACVSDSRQCNNEY